MERLVVFLLVGGVGNLCLGCGPVDLSGDCSDNIKINYFLTQGMGYADGFSAYIGGFHKNCSVGVFTNDLEVTTVQIIVLETIGYMDSEEFCKNNSVTIIDESITINPCAVSQTSDDHILYAGALNSHETHLQIRGDSPEMLKVTATSARELKENENCRDWEIECVVRKRLLCINVDLQCDGNINCGSYGLFDEDTATCFTDNYKRHVALIIAGVFLSTITLLILIKLCYQCIPKLPRHYFETDNLEDNKLIVSSHMDPPKKLSVERKQALAAASGDALERIDEKEIRTLYYEKPPKKRLTTNSPVYRNTRVATILLDNIKNMQDVDEFVTDTDAADSHSAIENFRKNKSKFRRHSISDFI